ncbi:DUF6223 family protein [Streptomyces microflavus]|uniref:DUF6223 family protein n=1 Tax=Streptomyces microflavus TaxID=1919 RepID=UPI003B21821F
MPQRRQGKCLRLRDDRSGARGHAQVASQLRFSDGEGGERHQCFSSADGGRRGRDHRRRADGGNLALGAGPLGPMIGWPALTRVRGRAGGARTGGMTAIAVGTVGTVLVVLHLATSSGDPGTGNGRVGAVAAVPLGLGGVLRLRRSPDGVGPQADVGFGRAELLVGPVVVGPLSCTEICGVPDARVTVLAKENHQHHGSTT